MQLSLAARATQGLNAARQRHCWSSRLFGVNVWLALLGFGMAQGGLAQTKDSIVDSPQLDTVIVSARKRDESLAKVPESITAFTPESLTALEIQSFNDYATKTPNVSFTYGIGSTGISNARTVAIRGITGQNLFGTAGATGFYIDDTPVPEAVDPRVLDIDRVEVLKGPQGTLFGESSLGGNIRLITKRPDMMRNDVDYMAQAGLTSRGGSADSGALLNGGSGTFAIRPSYGLADPRFGVRRAA